MANWTRLTKITTTVRYVLDSPTNGVELSKMLSAADTERRGAHPGALGDEALTITAEDGLIVISWEVD